MNKSSLIERSANLLGAVALALTDRIDEVARAVLNRAGETPAAVVVIGYGLGPSNDRLRRILRLSHPGSVRLVDRLVEDGLVERRAGSDKRAVALYLTRRGQSLREQLMKGRLAAVRSVLTSLTDEEQDLLNSLLGKVLSAMGTTDLERCTICRLCDDRACGDCPIPADFKKRR
jgi:DNA-binding MarR family transcriptional regulator